MNSLDFDIDLDDFTNLNSSDIYKVYDLINDNDEKSEESVESKINSCENCGRTEFKEDYAKGIIFCLCGQVIDDIQADGNANKFDMDDNKKDGIVHNSLLPQSSLGSAQRVTGRFAQVSTWTRMPYRERSMNYLFKKIEHVCKIEKIPKKIEMDAQIICKRVCDKKHTTGKNKGKSIITRGENRQGIVASCLFIACSRYQETRSKKEISKYFGITEESLNKGYKSLKKILCDDNLIKDIETSSVCDFIERKCDEMNIMNKYKQKALNIASNVEKLNIASKHSTNSITSAVILLMGKLNNISEINKNTISKAFNNLSIVTIKKTFEEVEKFKPFLLDDRLTNKLIRTLEERKKHKKIINKETFDKMKQFGINTSKYRVMDQDDINDLNFIKKKEFYINQYEKIVDRNQNKFYKSDDLEERIDIMKNIVSFQNEILKSKADIVRRNIKELQTQIKFKKYLN